MEIYRQKKMVNKSGYTYVERVSAPVCQNLSKLHSYIVTVIDSTIVQHCLCSHHDKNITQIAMYIRLLITFWQLRYPNSSPIFS